MNVNLTNAEYLIACMVAGMRQSKAIQSNRSGRYGGHTRGVDSLKIHALGALGEMAVAKALNLYWSGFYGHSLSLKDVDKYQVRTGSKSHHNLILHQKDDSNDIYILVVPGTNDLEYTLVGWIFGKEGKIKDYWNDPSGGRPAFFVPQKALYSIELLQNKIRE